MARKKKTVETDFTIEDLFGDPEPPDPPKPESPEEEEPDEDPPSKKKRDKNDVGPHMFDCGHNNWYTEAENTAAREVGHCCAGHKTQPHWQALRGKYLRPVPTRYHRSPDHHGFPGYCVDDKGYYIGGVGNDCRSWGEGRICKAHQRKSGKVDASEDEDT